MNPTKTRCLIIGSGPAGYTAAIYASRANMNPILYEGMQRGGQLTITSMVDNFPGYPEGRMGGDIMEDIRQQALRFGAEIREGEILSVDFSKRPFRCTADDGTQIEAETVIIGEVLLTKDLLHLPSLTAEANSSLFTLHPSLSPQASSPFSTPPARRACPRV